MRAKKLKEYKYEINERYEGMKKLNIAICDLNDDYCFYVAKQIMAECPEYGVHIYTTTEAIISNDFHVDLALVTPEMNNKLENECNIKVKNISSFINTYILTKEDKQKPVIDLIQKTLISNNTQTLQALPRKTHKR